MNVIKILPTHNNNNRDTAECRPSQYENFDALRSSLTSTDTATPTDQPLCHWSTRSLGSFNQTNNPFRRRGVVAHGDLTAKGIRIGFATTGVEAFSWGPGRIQVPRSPSIVQGWIKAQNAAGSRRGSTCFNGDLSAGCQSTGGQSIRLKGVAVEPMVGVFGMGIDGESLQLRGRWDILYFG